MVAELDDNSAVCTTTSDPEKPLDVELKLSKDKKEKKEKKGKKDNENEKHDGGKNEKENKDGEFYIVSKVKNS